MKNTKALFLFLALILPVCIFLFLKFFGKNEFEVKPLFLDSAPPVVTGCPAVAVPYVVDDSIRTQLAFGSDSLLIILFSYETQPITNQVRRIEDEVENLPVRLLTLSESDRHLFWKQCVFCLNEPLDVVLLDSKGQIRGQYISADRDEIDRLLTEITIILKRY